MKVSKVHCLLMVLVLALLGACVPSVSADTQQIVINDQPEGRTQGLAADQVEQLETEKFTFQVSRYIYI